MSSHTTNSSSSGSSESSIPAYQRELAVFLGLCKTSPEFGRGLIVRTMVSSRHRIFDKWVNKKTVLNAFLDWLHTNDHKVNGRPSDDSIIGQWYCEASDIRFAIIPLQGTYIVVSFLSRTMNPGLMATDKHYELLITKPPE